MENLKLDELICLTAWSAAFADGQKDSSESNATEKEKNIVRAMRVFFNMDVDRFNKSNQKYETLTGHLIELEDKDPITKIISRYSATKVAFAENEDGIDKSNLSDKEWGFIIKIDNLLSKKNIADDIKDLAYNLVNEMCASELLIDNDLLDLIEMEKEDGTIYRRCIQPLLQAFFISLEKNNLFDTWEENYLALIKNKLELQSMFGELDLKEFDTRYKELKPIISNFKKDKADREKQLAKENEAKQKQLAKEKAEEEKNKTHEYSVSNGIDFCRYCGLDSGYNYRDCNRQNGHQYSVKRVPISYSVSFEYKPICKKCGLDSGYNFRDCR